MLSFTCLVRGDLPLFPGEGKHRSPPLALCPVVASSWCPREWKSSLAGVGTGTEPCRPWFPTVPFNWVISHQSPSSLWPSQERKPAEAKVNLFHGEAWIPSSLLFFNFLKKIKTKSPLLFLLWQTEGISIISVTERSYGWFKSLESGSLLRAPWALPTGWWEQSVSSNFPFQDLSGLLEKTGWGTAWNSSKNLSLQHLYPGLPHVPEETEVHMNFMDWIPAQRKGAYKCPEYSKNISSILGKGEGLTGPKALCPLVRQMMGHGGRSFSHVSDKHKFCWQSMRPRPGGAEWLKQRLPRAALIHSTLLSH